MGEKQMNYDDFSYILEDLINAYCGDCSVNVYFTSFNPQRLTNTDGKIVKYMGEKESLQTLPVDPVSFLRDELSQYHNYVCAWFFQKLTKFSNTDFYLDNFRGPITTAWGELIDSRNNIFLFPRGDQCNPFIATSDIICKYVDLVLRREKGRFFEEDILKSHKLIVKDFKAIYIGNNCISDMIPLYQDKNKMGNMIDTSKYLKTPHVYIVRETFDEVVSAEQAIELLETTGLMDAAYKMAYENGGSIKLFEKTDRICDGDIFITYGQKGKDTFERYINLGANIKHYSAKDLLKKR